MGSSKEIRQNTFQQNIIYKIILRQLNLLIINYLKQILHPVPPLIYKTNLYINNLIHELLPATYYVHFLKELQMKNYVLLVLSLVFMTNLSAQDEAYYPAQKSRYLGIEGIFNCPILDLDANNYRDGAGISMSGFGDITSNRNPLVLQWGVEGLFGVSNKNRTYNIGSPFSGTISNPTNVAVGLNGLLRLEYRKYAVHPYIDGFVGGRFFQSGYYVNNNDDWSELQSTTNAKWAYGAGVGAFIPVSKRLDINVRAAYTHTDDMQYIDMNDFIDNSRNSINNPATSDYDMLSLHVGIRYNITRNKNKYEKETRRDRRSTRYESDCDCDTRRHRDCRRKRPIISILLGNLGGPRICTPPPTDCTTGSYPSSRPNYDYNDDDNYTPPRNNDSGNGTTCPPAYEPQRDTNFFDENDNENDDYTPQPPRGGGSDNGATCTGYDSEDAENFEPVKPTRSGADNSKPEKPSPRQTRNVKEEQPESKKSTRKPSIFKFGKKKEGSKG